MNQVCNVKGVESRTNVLVTGASGQLGVRLLACAATRTDVDVVGLSRDELDVTNDQAVRNALRLHRPDVVIHAAAFTGVDDAEDREKRHLGQCGGRSVGFQRLFGGRGLHDSHQYRLRVWTY